MEDGQDKTAPGAPSSRRRHGRRLGTASGADADTPPPLPCYPPSPSSTSSSDFEFTVSLSPQLSKTGGSNLCPADELFYKGQLLPLHLSPRLSMVRSLLLASSSSSSCSDSTITASRDSSGSSTDSTVSAFSSDVLVECDSSRPSSVTEEDASRVVAQRQPQRQHKYFSSLATRFSSVFHRKKDAKHHDPPPEIGGNNVEAVTQERTSSSTSGRRSTGKSGTSSSAKEVFKKYVKKVKPLYEKLEKLSTLQQHRNQQHKWPVAAGHELRKKTFSFSVRRGDRSALDRVMMSASASRKEREVEEEEERQGEGGEGAIYAHSFSGNLRYLRRRPCAGATSSCPSSMRSSPSHSGLLYSRERGGGGVTSVVDPASAADIRACRFPPSSWPSSSSMEELQSAIQGAIAHCKSTLAVQSNQGKVSTATSEQTWHVVSHDRAHHI